MSKRRDINLIQKMIDYCNEVEKAMEIFGRTFEDYCNQSTFQLACSACIIQLGESINRMTDEFKARHDEIDWYNIKTLRNLNTHEYENLRLKVMWAILTQKIPKLRKQLEQILAAEGDSNEN